MHSFFSLPDEIVCEILLFLPFPTGRSLALTSRYFYDLFLSNEWVRRHFRRVLLDEILGLFKLQKDGPGRRSAIIRREVLFERAMMPASPEEEESENAAPRILTHKAVPLVLRDSEQAQDEIVDPDHVSVSYLWETEGTSKFRGAEEAVWKGMRGYGRIPTSDLVPFWLKCCCNSSRNRKMRVISEETKEGQEETFERLEVAVGGGSYYGEERGSWYMSRFKGQLFLRFFLDDWMLQGGILSLKAEVRTDPGSSSGYGLGKPPVVSIEEDLIRKDPSETKLTNRGRRRRRGQ